MRRVFGTFRRDQRGATVVEVSLLTGVFAVLTGGAVEMGMYLHAHNAAQTAARHGARLAATGEPVSRWLKNYNGLGNGVVAGDPLPDYSVECSGADRRCTRGGYDADGMKRLVFGPDGTGCGDAERRLQGMCSFARVDARNVSVRYESSGLGTAGRPADPVPLITVTVSGLSHDFVFLDRILPGEQRMGSVSASVLAEGLEGL